MNPADPDTGELLGSIHGGFSWGLLVVSDPDSSGEIPTWASPDEPVTSTTGALVVRVEHEQEGPATVHVYRGIGDLASAPAFDGSITSASGELTVGDALAGQWIRVSVALGMHRLRIVLNRPTNANHIDVAID